jgi:hypothetical protein
MAESGHENRASRRWATIRWSAVAVLGLLALGYLLAVPLGSVAPDERLSTPEVILGGALLAGLAFADRLGELRFGSVILTLRDVQVRQAKLETEVEAFRDRVTTLFLNTMAPSMYRNLVSLRDRHRPYDEAHRADLMREMTLLRDLGYVDDLDGNQFEPMGDLSRHIQVTERGREFIELREALESRSRSHGG